MAREDKLREKNKTIGQLKAQVRQLRKQLKLAESEMDLMRELWERDIIEMAKKERRKQLQQKKVDLCPDCGNPTLKITKVGIWTLVKCESCDFFDRSQNETD